MKFDSSLSAWFPEQKKNHYCYGEVINEREQVDDSGCHADVGNDKT